MSFSRTYFGGSASILLKRGIPFKFQRESDLLFTSYHARILIDLLQKVFHLTLEHIYFILEIDNFECIHIPQYDIFIVRGQDKGNNLTMSSVEN